MNLDKVACQLVRLGHHGVWAYPWSLFLHAIKG